MIEGWKKWPKEKPTDPNCIKNFCLVKLTNNDYIIASYSIHTEIWRHISYPIVEFAFNKMIDEIIDNEQIDSWILIK